MIEQDMVNMERRYTKVDMCLIDLAVETNGRVPNVTRKGIG